MCWVIYDVLEKHKQQQQQNNYKSNKKHSTASREFDMPHKMALIAPKMLL